MKVKRIAGIDRVLDQVLTLPQSHGQTTAEDAAQGTKTTAPIPPVSFSGERRVLGRVEARRGRPVGKRTSALPREKVTLRISRHLVADYRDWSWDARCNFSHLVERALAEYRHRHRSGQHEEELPQG